MTEHDWRKPMKVSLDGGHSYVSAYSDWWCERCGVLNKYYDSGRCCIWPETDRVAPDDCDLCVIKQVLES